MKLTEFKGFNTHFSINQFPFTLHKSLAAGLAFGISPCKDFSSPYDLPWFGVILKSVCYMQQIFWFLPQFPKKLNTWISNETRPVKNISTISTETLWNGFRRFILKGIFHILKYKWAEHFNDKNSQCRSRFWKTWWLWIRMNNAEKYWVLLWKSG